MHWGTLQSPGQPSSFASCLAQVVQMPGQPIVAPEVLAPVLDDILSSWSDIVSSFNVGHFAIQLVSSRRAVWQAGE